MDRLIHPFSSVNFSSAHCHGHLLIRGPFTRSLNSIPMNSRKRRLLWLGGLLLLFAIVGSTAWTKRRELFPNFAAKATGTERPDSKHGSGDAAEREKARRVNALYEATLAKHPGLAVTYKAVPDDRNGYLKWCQFAQRHPGDSFGLPAEIKRMMKGEEWDVDKVAAWMNEHADLMAEIMEIGLTPDQSAKGVSFPKDGGVRFKLAKEATDLLLMRARMEAERGSTETSLQSLQATMGLADHLDQIETPSLLHATVSILIRSSVSNQFFKRVMPALPDDSSDLSGWHQNRESSAGEFGRLLIGEWHTATRNITLPALVSGEEEWKGVSDPEALLDRWAGWVEAQAQACDRTDLGHLSNTLASIHVEGGGTSLDELHSFMPLWSKAWVREQIQCQQQNAAFAYMRGEPLPNEPVTGKPFVWDEASQSITLPEDERLKEVHVDPIVIKRPRSAQ
jgi:hypothetical protein